MTTGVRKAGEFCWHNMLTPDVAEARAFFGELPPCTGHTVHVRGRLVGAIFDLAARTHLQGRRHSSTYWLKIASADAACQKVAQAGRDSSPAFDVEAPVALGV